MWHLTVDFTTIAKAFPIILAANPYVTQAVKRALDPILKKSQNYDMDVRILTCVLAALVGLAWLFMSSLQLHSLADLVITLVALITYGLGGGVMSMAAYSFVNSYLHQTPPVTPPDPVMQGMNISRISPAVSPIETVAPMPASEVAAPPDTRQPY